MAFPFIWSNNFDTGDNSEFGSEDDGEGMLDFPHYTDLAKISGAGPLAPYRGAYCMRVQPTDTNAHSVTEGSMNISLNATGDLGFAFYVGTDVVTGGVTDVINICEVVSASGVEAAVSLQVVTSTNVVNLGIGETAAATFPVQVEKGVWHTVELRLNIDQGTQDDGTIDLTYDGNVDLTQITAVDQAAITDVRLGTFNTLAATNGTFLFDEIIHDVGRLIYPPRYSTTRLLSAAQSFLFVGPGWLDQLYLRDGGTGDVIARVFDTDVYSAGLVGGAVWEGRTVTANTDIPNAVQSPIKLINGCLVTLAGTTPGAIATFRPSVWGAGAVRHHGLTKSNTLMIGYK